MSNPNPSQIAQRILQIAQTDKLRTTLILNFQPLDTTTNTNASLAFNRLMNITCLTNGTL